MKFFIQLSPKYFHSFKEVNLILTCKIIDKLYAQTDFGLYFLMCQLKRCDINLVGGYQKEPGPIFLEATSLCSQRQRRAEKNIEE